METNYLTILAEKRQAYEEKRAALEAQRADLDKELKQMKEKFDSDRQALNKLFNHPTKHSIAARRKADAHRIRRVLGGTLSEWQCPYLDGAMSSIGFTIEEDRLVFNIAVPFKHSLYEDQLDLF